MRTSARLAAVPPAPGVPGSRDLHLLLTAVQFNPIDQADNRHQRRLHPAFAGPPTAQYLDRVLSRWTLPGSLYLAAVATCRRSHPLRRVPQAHVERASRRTSILIVVGVALDDMRQIESQMMMRHYEGFLKMGARPAVDATRHRGTWARLARARKSTWRISEEAGSRTLPPGISFARRSPPGPNWAAGVESYNARGELVPDRSCRPRAPRSFSPMPAGVVLTRLSPTLAQAQALDTMMEGDLDREVSVVLNFPAAGGARRAAAPAARPSSRAAPTTRPR